MPDDDFFNKAKLVIEKCEKKAEFKLQIEFEHFLKSYFEDMGFPDIEGEYNERPGGGVKIISRKRQDATYGKLVIEYEPVGKLLTEAGKSHAIKQITDDYLGAYSKDERTSMAGIVFDGKKIIFIRWVKTEWFIEERDFDSQSLDMMISYIAGLFRISFRQLPSKFGFHRQETKKALKLLYEKTFMDNERAKMLFNEWSLRFSSIYGNAFNEENIKNHFKDIASDIGIDNVDGGRLVFVIHTYYALIVKIIATEIAKNLFAFAHQSHIKKLHLSEKLADELREIEDGKFFTDLGVENFVEGTFLSWYLDVWDDEIKQIVSTLIKDLEAFDTAEFNTRPDEVVDYLKNFYQEVFPKQLRHDLGEFYTPDWLAGYIVNTTGYDGDISKRVLDPACGSGTFLIAVLNKIYEKNRGSTKKERLIELITHNIVGFDINPVAVLTARTNYLISLARFNFQKTRFSIPIYLTDSIVLPELAIQTKLSDEASLYQIKTTKAIFNIPRSIEGQIIQVMHFLKGCLERKIKREMLADQLKQEFNFEEKEIYHLTELYEQMTELNKKNQNKIWCDIIINQFATLFQEKFDFVIGNPPWVNWEFLNDEYQKHLIELNDKYGLFFTKGLESRLGMVKRDISAIFFYVCSDIYLKDNGKLAFLIKPMYQIPSGKGFRNFNRSNAIYPKEGGIKGLFQPLNIFLVEDLTKENPFEINNQVSLIFAEKNSRTTYPIRYLKWGGNRTHELMEYHAEPSDPRDMLSTWTIYQGKRQMSTFGACDYRIRAGIYFGLKPAFFDLKILIGKDHIIQITNCDGKTKDIEKGLVYPVIMSRHINKWKICDKDGKRYTYGILPQTRPTEDNEEEVKIKYPKTWDWLYDFKTELLARKSKVFLKKPFYSIYGLGDWDSKFKVVWVRMGFSPDFTVVSSVHDEFLGEKLVLPENVNMFIPTNNKEEAHYICAVLNSNPVKEALFTLSGGGKAGISKEILSKIRLDLFEKDNAVHKRLSQLSIEAHELANKNDFAGIALIQREINELIKKLYKTKKLVIKSMN